MSFTLIEHLNGISLEIARIARILQESHASSDKLLVETADSVLNQMYTMLKNGGQMTPQETDDYAQVLTGLSILSIDDNRQTYHIDISTTEGQQKFLNIMDHVGEDKSITLQIRRLATEEVTSEYKKNLKKMETFRQMSPTERQQFLVAVNKLRLGYHKLREMITTGEFQQKRDALIKKASKQ